MSKKTILTPRALTAAAFAAFGEVIDTQRTKPMKINQGFAERFDDLCSVDVGNEGGAVKLSLFVAQPRPRPFEIKLMERHPLGSQAFIPMQDKPWLVLVCDDPLVPSSYTCFAATGKQGVNYAKGTWHHPLLVFDDASHFSVVDRIGPGNNLEEVWLPEHLKIEIAA